MTAPLVRSLPTHKIHPANTALLIIDMERDFIDAGAVEEASGGRELVPAINTPKRFPLCWLDNPLRTGWK